MKVKELVQNLQKLDQEKNIWIYYDLYSFLEPDEIKMLTKEDWEEDDPDKVGDYIIEAW